MKIIPKIVPSILALTLGANAWAAGFGLDSIASNASKQQTTMISQISSSVTAVWSTLATVCTAGAIPAPGTYAIVQSALPHYVSSIANGPNCTLTTVFTGSKDNASVPVPLANKIIVILPNCNSTPNNLPSCAYSNPLCYTNIYDGAGMFASPPPPGTQVTLVSNSSFNVSCYYYANPIAAAALSIQGNNNVTNG